MYNRLAVSILTLTLCLIPHLINARIINVPDDFETIQNAINGSQNEDTVLVSPGIYVENINFEGRGITVASLILTTDDRAYIDSTIIDGNSLDCVVAFNNGEDSTSVLRGFTITNGLQNWGGGIDCQPQSSPILIDLLVVENEARAGGGGMHCSTNTTPRVINVTFLNNICTGAYGGGGLSSVYNAHPVIIDSRFINNHSTQVGGGLYTIAGGSFTLDHVLITGNEAEEYGGGLYISSGTELRLINTTISRNSAERGGGIYFYPNSMIQTILTNSIVWENEPSEIELVNCNQNALRVSYSDIRGGLDEIVGEIDEIVVWLDGNIDEDPLFVDPDEGDYHLAVDSPCIDTGDPEFEPDPDGTRADMGAIPFFQGGSLEIFVLDAENDGPLEDAIVYTDYGFTAMTDEDGYCRLLNVFTDREFSLTAIKTGYNDSTITGLSVEMDDTLEVIFRLLHPEFIPSPQEITGQIAPGEIFETEISILNNGNGALEWLVEPRRYGDAGADAWILRNSINVGELTDDARIEGVVFIDSLYYVSGANRSGREDLPDQIYILNRAGELIDSLLQPEEIDGNYGLRDLAYDGELIWGTGSNMIGGFTTGGEVRIVFEGPYNTNKALAWDPDRGVLWASGITQGITGVDRNGNVILRLRRQGFRIYGLAYWQDDPDGYPLYIFHNPSGEKQVIHKMNPETSDTLFVKNLGEQLEGSAAAAFITRELDDDSWVFLSIANDGCHDRIDVWHLAGITDWMLVEPAEGIIQAEQEQILGFTLDATDLIERIYEGQLRFQHNAAGMQTSLPVTLTVSAHSVHQRATVIPDQFGITGIHPNPFNSVTRIAYSLQKTGYIELAIYDLTGRRVDVIDRGFKPSGCYSMSYNALSLPSGVYILSLTTIQRSSVKKMLLIK